MAYNQVITLKVEGIKRISWKDKETKEQKSGAVLQCSYKEDGISGMGVATMFVDTDRLISDNLAVGVRIMAFDRGKYGMTYIGKSEK